MHGRFLIFAALGIMSVVTVIAQEAEGPEPTFVLRSSTRQKLTTTSIDVTVQAKKDISTLSLKIAGATIPVHDSETTGIDHEMTVGNLKAGQKTQISTEVTSTSGQSGELSVTGRAVDEGFSVAAVQAAVPYQNKNGELKLQKSLGAKGDVVAVTAKPVQKITFDGYILEGDMKLVSKGFVGVDQGAAIKLRAEGITLLDSKNPATNSNREVVQPVRFAAADGQKGRIIAEITGKSKTGQPFVRRAYLYVLATAFRVYTGTSGFTELEIQQLKDDQSAHRITDQQFAAAMTAILSGATDAGVPK